MGKALNSEIRRAALSQINNEIIHLAQWSSNFSGPWGFWFTRSGVWVCISNKLPGDTGAAGLGPHFEEKGSLWQDSPYFRKESTVLEDYSRLF